MEAPFEKWCTEILAENRKNIFLKVDSIRKKWKMGNLEILARNRKNIFLKSYSMYYECL